LTQRVIAATLKYRFIIQGAANNLILPAEDRGIAAKGMSMSDINPNPATPSTPADAKPATAGPTNA